MTQEHNDPDRDVQAEAAAYRELKKRADEAGFASVNDMIDALQAKQDSD